LIHPPCRQQHQRGEKGQVMRALTWIVGILAVLWSGYWFVGARAVEKGATDWFAAQSASGMIAEYGDLNVAGFPNRFDLTVTQVDLINPVTNRRWQVPLVQVFAMTWKPWHIIAVLGGEQRIELAGQSVILTTDDARASVKFQPNTDLGLSALSTSLTQAKALSSLGWTMAAELVELHTRLNATAANAHDIALDATNIAPDAALLARTTLPAEISQIRLRATATFSAALDRNAAETQPRIIGWRVDEGSILWGDLTVTAKGDIAANADGLAEGRIDITIKGWRLVIPAIVAAGLVKPDVAPTVESLLTAMAAQSGDPETLLLPLVFANGRGTLGPLPLGPAPRLN
jgi:hypothetical protein